MIIAMNEAIRAAKSKEPKKENMYYPRHNTIKCKVSVKFWDLFYDPTPGKLTIYTDEELVIARLLYHWMDNL